MSCARVRSLIGSRSENGTIAAVQALLRQIAFRNSGNDPGTATRTITFTVNDGTAGSNSPTVTVQVSTSNDAPQIGNVSGTATYVGEGEKVAGTVS